MFVHLPIPSMKCSLHQYLTRLCNANLQLQIDKWKFGYFEAYFLGLLISPEGISPMKKCLRHWAVPEPSNKERSRKIPRYDQLLQIVHIQHGRHKWTAKPNTKRRTTIRMDWRCRESPYHTKNTPIEDTCYFIARLESTILHKSDDTQHCSNINFVDSNEHFCLKSFHPAFIIDSMESDFLVHWLADKIVLVEGPQLCSDVVFFICFCLWCIELRLCNSGLIPVCILTSRIIFFLFFVCTVERSVCNRCYYFVIVKLKRKIMGKRNVSYSHEFNG